MPGRSRRQLVVPEHLVATVNRPQRPRVSLHVAMFLALLAGAYLAGSVAGGMIHADPRPPAWLKHLDPGCERDWGKRGTPVHEDLRTLPAPGAALPPLAEAQEAPRGDSDVLFVWWPAVLLAVAAAYWWPR